MDTIKTLRKEISRKRGVEDGTVVRFKREQPEYRTPPTSLREGDRLEPTGATVTLDYVAVYVAATQRWYLSGTMGIGRSPHTHDAFLEILASPDVSAVAVATGWEEVG